MYVSYSLLILKSYIHLGFVEGLIGIVAVDLVLIISHKWFEFIFGLLNGHAIGNLIKSNADKIKDFGVHNIASPIMSNMCLELTLNINFVIESNLYGGFEAMSLAKCSSVG